MKVLTTILFLSMAASVAIAQDDLLLEEEEEIRRYTVELIVFTYAENVSVGTEIFPPDEIARKDYDRDNQGRRPVFLGESEFTLSDIVQRFERLDVYETILHVGWTQTTHLEEETRTIELREFGNVPAGLDGSFTLYLNRYLHLVVDLSLDAPGQFNEPVIFDEPEAAFGDSRRQFEADIEAAVLPVRYRIQDDRIFKNGDVRYFDHPKFGIVAKITRVEEEELEQPPLVSD
ncbi:MAG: CsiV family protein, partial [Woeseiaceae bacterium]|nr:CsiV family protein [Woeseiaceae bacterium]